MPARVALPGVGSKCLLLPVLVLGLMQLCAANVAYQAASVMDDQITFPFDALVVELGGNTDIRGITVSTLFNDCDFGSRFFFPPSRPLPALYSSTFDYYTCSLHIFHADSTKTAKVTDFAFLLRRVAFLRVGSGAWTSPSFRVGWQFWIGGREQPVSMAEPNHAMHCAPTPVPTLSFDAAQTYCTSWIPWEGGSKTSPATLVCPAIENTARLLDYLRRSEGREENTGSGPATQTLKGYLAWTGQLGTEANFANGARVASYQPFGRDEPRGPYPSVMADDNKWYSATKANELPVCCESTLTSSYEQARTGRVVFTSSASTAVWESPDVVMPTDAGVAPFDEAQVSLASGNGPFYGASVSVHTDDCAAGGVRWILSGLDEATVNATHDVLLCGVVLYPAGDTEEWTRAETHAAIKALRLVNIAPENQPAPFANGTRVRVSYAMLTEQHRAYVHPPAGDPTNQGPHMYQCFYDPVRWREAATACGEWGGGLGYLATPQHAWEQHVVERLRGQTAKTDDAWIGAHTWFTSAAGNDFKLSNGDATGYTNWAANEPQLRDAPVVMSSTDGTWRGVFNEYHSNYSYCCERTTIPEHAHSGRVNVIPVGTDAAARESYETRRAYATERDFMPFVKLSAADVAGAASTGWGVTFTLEFERCVQHRANVSWGFSGGSLPVGYIGCPPLPGETHSDSQKLLCPTASHAVLQKRCTWTVIREDKSLPGALFWISDIMARVVLSMDTVLAYPQDETRVAWALWHRAAHPFPLLNATNGHAVWCSDQRVGFARAAEVCTEWSADAYIATIQAVDEAELIADARRSANDFTTVGSNAWLGLERRKGTFLNGDAVRFTRWISGQPDGSGPTQLDGDGQWSNVGEYAFGQQRTAAFCCERPAAGTAGVEAPATGVVVVTGRTLTTTVSQGSETPSESHEPTLSRQLTTQLIVPTHTSTRTSRSESITEEGTDSGLPTPSNEVSNSSTFSGRESLSDSVSLTAAPRRRVTIEVVDDGEVHADAIRGRIPEMNHAYLRTVRFKITNNWFRANTPGRELRRYVHLRERQSTFFGFSALRGLLVSDDSFSATAMHLSITFNVTDKYDVTENEVIFVHIERGATYMDELDTPDAFDELPVVILHGGEATNLADAAITFANFLAVLGSPSAFKDQQAMAIIGAMKCARGAQRTVFRATGRIISPLKFGNELYAQWLGSFLPSFAFVWLHVGLVLFMLRDVRRLRPNKVMRRVARVYFPSVSLFVIQMLHIGVVFYALELFKVMDTPGWEFLATFTLMYAALAVSLVIFWSVVDRILNFVEYTPAEFSEVPTVLGVVVPFGYWSPDSAQRMTRWAIGDFHFKRYVGFEYIVGIIVASLAAWMPDNVDVCVTQYAIMASFFIVCSITIIALRPFRSHFANGAAALSNILLSATMICATVIVDEPFGDAHVAMNTVRWLMTGLVGLRGLVGISVFYLEWRLVGKRRVVLQAEAERIKQKQALDNIINDSRPDVTAALGKEGPLPVPHASDGATVHRDPHRLNPLDRDAAAMSQPLLSLSPRRGHDDFAEEPSPTRRMFADAAGQDDHTMLASILNQSRAPSIYTPLRPQDDELERRQRLMRVLDDSQSPRTGHVTRAGPRELPDWL